MRHRDPPALPRGGLGLGKVVHLNTKLKTTGAKGIAYPIVPFVIPFWEAENYLDEG